MSTFPSPFGPLIGQDLTLVFGFFGAGKTFYTVEEAHKAYKKGYVVVSNMWLAFPHVRWYTSEDLPPIIEEIQQYHDEYATPRYAPKSYLGANGIKPENGKTRRFFFLIDEAAIFFNARNFKKNFDKPEMIEFFVQPRKFDCTIAVICQSLNMIDVNFVRLAQEVVEFRKWIGGLFRLGEGYDISRLNLEEGGIDPQTTPVTRRKFFLHHFYTYKAKAKFIGGLYYTKEILGDRAVRRPEHIRSVKDYFFQETTDPHFHNWYEKTLKAQIFGLSEKEAEEDSENAQNEK